MANTSNILRRTRETLIATEEFQTWIGLDLTAGIVARKTAARERVFRWHLPGWSRDIMPCILLFPAGYNGTRGSMGGGSFRWKQGVEAVFFAIRTEDELSGYETDVSGIETFDDTALGIVQAAMKLSGSADHIQFGNAEQTRPPTANGWDVIDTQDSRRSDIAGFPYICTVWRFEGVRFGETAL